MQAQPEVSAPFTNPTAGEAFTITCNTSYSIPAPVISWMRNGMPVTESPVITIESRRADAELNLYTYASDLIFSGIQPSDAGSYACMTSQSDSQLNMALTASSNSLQVSVHSKSFFTPHQVFRYSTATQVFSIDHI